MTTVAQTVLILGAGINGCALARELALNGVSVWVVDCADLARVWKASQVRRTGRRQAQVARVRAVVEERRIMQIGVEIEDELDAFGGRGRRLAVVTTGERKAHRGRSHGHLYRVAAVPGR